MRRRQFFGLVGGALCNPKHFIESDLPLLVSCVQAVDIAQTAARDPTKTLHPHRARRECSRLRLAPQARTDPKTISRMKRSTSGRPWNI